MFLKTMTVILVCAGLHLLPATTCLAAPGDLPAADTAKLDAAADDQARLVILKDLAAARPEDAAVQYHLGNLLYDMGQMDTAIEAYRAAIEQDDQIIGAYVNLGSALDEKGELEPALVAYDQALALDPKDPRTLCNVGGVYFQKRQYAKAIGYFQDALKADPKSQLAHYNIAIAFADAEIYREAIAEWEAAVALDPESDVGHRSADNIEIMKQMMTTEVPEIKGR